MGTLHSWTMVRFSLRGSLRVFDAVENRTRTQTIAQAEDESAGPSVTLETEEGADARFVVYIGGEPITLDASNVTAVESSQRMHGVVTLVADGAWEIRVTEASPAETEQ